MFGDHFYLEPLSSSKSLDSATRAKQSSAFDLQYEICSRYMKIASEQLCQREIELMQSTHKFFERITDSFSLKDISSTQESFTLDSILEDEDPFAQPSKSRLLLLRKSKSNSSLRRTDTGMSDALREVQKKCSEKTSTLVANMSNEYKRMKEKLATSEKYEKDLKKLEAKFLLNEEQLVLIKRKASDLEMEKKAQSDQCSALKKKLKEINDESLKIERQPAVPGELASAGQTQEVYRGEGGAHLQEGEGGQEHPGQDPAGHRGSDRRGQLRQVLPVGEANQGVNIEVSSLFGGRVEGRRDALLEVQIAILNMIYFLNKEVRVDTLLCYHHPQQAGYGCQWRESWMAGDNLLKYIQKTIQESKLRHLLPNCCPGLYPYIQFLLMSMIAESDQECLYNRSFQQDIKNCRFYCQIVDNRLKCQLIDIFQDHYYQTEYDASTTPEQFTKYNKNLEEVYQFISIKTKIFKNPHPGVILCCQYMGRVEKFITIRMAKVEPPMQVKENCHFALLQRCCRDLLTKIHILRADLKVKSKELTFSSHQCAKKINLTNQKETRRGKYQISCSLKKTKRPTNNIQKRQNSVQQTAQYKQIQSKTPQLQEQCKVDVVPAQTRLPDHIPQNQAPKQPIIVETMQVEACEQKMLLNLSKTSPFYNRFRITGNQVEKINNSQPFQVHSALPIPKNSKTYFTVHIGKTKYKSISIGVLAQKYYQKTLKAERRCFSMSYDGYYGIVLNQSLQVERDLSKFGEGDTVKTLVNLIQMSIEWSINAQAIAKVPISPQLSEDQLYPYIQMEDKGDIVFLNKEERIPK